MAPVSAAPGRRLRLGVVGLGAIAQTAHLPLIRRRWDLAEVVAVADISPARRDAVGDLYGVGPEHRHADLVRLLDAETLDGVVLLTAGSHGPEALECVRRGVPVLCEKPLAFTVAEADALAAAEAEQGRPLVLLGYMKEYDEAVDRAMEEIPADGIRAVDVEVLHPADGAQLAFGNLLPPTADVPVAAVDVLTRRTAALVDAAIGADTPAMLRALYTNVLLGSIVHDISLLRLLLGGIETVERVRHWPPEVMPGSIDVAGTVAGGAHLHLGWHYLPDYPAYRETLSVHHATGSVQLVFAVPYVLNRPTELTVVTATGTGEHRSTFRGDGEAFETELVAFHAMVVDRVPPRSGVAEGRADILTAQAMTRALARSEGLTLGGECAPDGEDGADAPDAEPRAVSRA